MTEAGGAARAAADGKAPAERLAGCAGRLADGAGGDTADYIQNGLLYCGRCKTPKQTRIRREDGWAVVPAMCRCRDEAYRRAEREGQRRQQYLRAMASPAAGLGLRIRTGRERCDGRVLRWLERWSEVRRGGPGLLLWGDVGTGKTASAAWAAEAVRRRGYPSLITTVGRLAGFEFGAAIPQTGLFDLLVLDDLGAERQTDYVLERMHEIIDSRVASGKPMIVTTNMSLDELRQPATRWERRIFDRLLSACAPVHFAGASRREAQREAAFERARQLITE